MSFAFKRFNFFQYSKVTGHDYPTDAICSAPSPSCLFVGTSGAIVALDESYKKVSSWTAYGHQTHELIWLENRGLLLSVGFEEPGCSTAAIKVWDVVKALPASPGTSSQVALQPLKTVKVFGPKQKEGEITAVAAKESATGTVTVAIGLATGLLYIHTLDLTGKAKPQPTTQLSARPDVGDGLCVQSLALTGDGEMLSVFAVTESQTLSFNVQTGAKTILDQQGVHRPRCCVLQNGLLTVAREEGLYDYTLDTRAGCTVFEGMKQQLAVLRRFLVVVTIETPEAGASSSTVNLTDKRNKMVAGSLTLTNVKGVVPAWGGLAVVTGAEELSRGAGVHVMKEVDLNTQLDSLFKRSLYKLALDVARAQKVDPATIAHIQQRWGDHLYSKGDYDASMQQYIETIGHLEPSYVIRRFLDAQRIHNLTCFLEQLHHRGLASSDHTTLLLNCYTKLKNVDKLDAFIHRDVGSPRVASPTADGQQQKRQRQGSASAAAPHTHHQGPKFDSETVVKVLRSAGYYDHALFVAEQAEQPDWVLDILLDNCYRFDEALAFLDTLPRQSCADALKRYGKALINHRPEATTRLLMELCIPGQDFDGTTYTASVADFAHLYTDKPTALMLLCEFILNSSPHGSVPNEGLLYHTLLELYLSDQLPDETTNEVAAATATATASAAAAVAAEASSSSTRGRQQEAPAEAAAALQQRQFRRSKALELLHSGWPPHLTTAKYDPDHVLVLCRLHAFAEGLVFLYDKLRLYREVLQVYMSSEDHSGLIAATVRYGDASKGGDPQLWSEVLDYFVAQPGDSCEPQILEVVDIIEAGKVLPPLVVLQALARNRALKVSSIRGYVSRQLGREMVDIARDREQVSKLTAETASMRSEVAKLKSQARVFQNSKCAASGLPLELPCVHFLCGHSFNLRSLGENDKECPICAPDFRRVQEIRRNLAASATNQDRFFNELRESADGFSVVAEHFGRGLMNQTAAALNAAAASTFQQAAAGAAAGGLLTGIAGSSGSVAGSLPVSPGPGGLGLVGSSGMGGLLGL